jgi:Na+-driven multidrug efflux pump
MRSDRVRLWRDRLLRFGAGAGGTAILAAGGVVRNKWLAMHLEAAGIGVVAQVAAGQAWLGALVGLGLGLPVTRAIGAAFAARDEGRSRRVVWSALLLVGLAAIPTAALGALFAAPISLALLGTPAHAGLVRISMLGVVGTGAFWIVQAMCAGRSDVRSPLAFAAGATIVATLVTFSLVPRFGLFGAVFGAALLYPAGVAAMFAIHRRAHRGAFTPLPRPLFDRAEAKALLSVSGAALLLPLVDQGTLLALRAHYLRVNGIAANGLLQAALALSQQVGSVFYAYLASYAFGKISGAGGPEGIQTYTRRQWPPLIGLAALAIAVAMIAAAPLLHLLYSSRFDAARPMMAATLLGEFGRVCLQAAAIGSLPLGGARLWAAIGLTQPLSLAGAYAVFARAGAGTMSLPRAYAVAGVVTFVVAAVLMARSGVSLRRRDLALAAAAYAALGLIAGLSGA